MEPGLSYSVNDCGIQEVGTMMSLVTEQEGGQQVMNNRDAEVLHLSRFGYNDDNYIQHHSQPCAQSTALCQSTAAFSVQSIAEHSYGKCMASCCSTKHLDDSTRKVIQLRDDTPMSPRYMETLFTNSHVVTSTQGVHETWLNKQPTDDTDTRFKIISHPEYPRLVLAYVNCQKVGAPPEIIARLEELSTEYINFQPPRTSSSLGEDPDLDEFMNAYSNMLCKYQDELARPIKEAMAFLRKTELQLNHLNKATASGFLLFPLLFTSAKRERKYTFAV